MTNQSLSSFSLPKYLLDKLNQSSIFTVQDLLVKYPMDLVKLLNISLPKVESLIQSVLSSPQIVPICAAQISDDFNINQLKVDELDQFTRIVFENNLIKHGMLSEICGPPGVGKTQFMFQLCSAHFQHCTEKKKSSIIFIDTENNFNSKRLFEVAKSRFESHEDLINMLKNVFVYKALTFREFEQCLEGLIEQEIVLKNAQMVIIDSLASIVRREFGGTDSSVLHDRGVFLARLSNRLKAISQYLDVAIVLSNQILSGGFSSGDESGSAVPALGSSWSHFVNTRLILQFVDNQKREILIAKSPSNPFMKYQFYITTDNGIEFDGENTIYAGMNPSLQRIKIKPY